MNKYVPFLYALVGVMCGCLLDVVVKFASADLTTLSITAGRYITAAIICVAILMVLRKPIPSWESARFHVMRGALQLTGTGAFFWALRELGLAEATIIGFTATLMLGPLAWVFLGERLDWKSAIATLAGFFGAALAISGTTDGAPPDGDRLMGVLAVLLAALCYAGALILLRFRTGKEDPVIIVAMANIMPLVYIVPAVLIVRDPFPVAYWGHLFLLGALGIGIWGSFTLAYTRSEAQYIAPIEYTALIWSAVFGVIIFGEWPSWHLYAGAAIIVISCLAIVISRSRPANRRAAV